MGVGHVGGAPKEILQALEMVRSNPFRRTFLKRLSELEVETGLARDDWHARLNRIQDVRFADDVEARYRFWGKLYRWKVDAGFDPKTGIFWMRRDDDVGPSRLYRTLAEQLVFKGAKPIELHALELAVGLQIKDPSFGTRTAFESAANGADDIVLKTTIPRSKGVPERIQIRMILARRRGDILRFTPDPTRNEPADGIR